MILPDYDHAVLKAQETAARYSSADPLVVLRRLPRVLLLSVGLPVDQDAFTCVQRRKDKLCYIVYYNPSLPAFQLRAVLARQLAHVVLQHDGSVSEAVWSEEANCFAYHFLCYRPPVRTVVLYRPVHKTLSVSFKMMQTFDSIDELRQSIADDQTRYNRFVGKNVSVSPSDVEIRSLPEKDIFGGWKNYSSVVVAGRPVGFCGE